MHDALGEAIRTARVARGWSQSELARRLGVHQATANGWENGRRTPSYEDVRRLEDLLGVRFSADAPDASTAYRMGYAVRQFEELQELGATIAAKAAAAAARMRDATPPDVAARGTEALAALDARPAAPASAATARPARRAGHR